MAKEIVFTEATREQLRLRMALTGVTGGGKTYTALNLMTYLLGGDVRDPSMAKRIALLDTERGSASRYAKGRPFHFFRAEPTSFEPEMFVAAIRAAERAGFEGLIIDSFSHEWIGTGGALEQVDRAAKNGNTFVAWGSVTPRHNAVIDAIMSSPLHIIATMRAKMAHEQTVDNNGKKVVRKLGLAAQQRDGIEYEFDIIGDMDITNELTITKSRCSELNGKFFKLPGRELATIINAWLDDGEPRTAADAAPPHAAPPRTVDLTQREPAPATAQPMTHVRVNGDALFEAARADALLGLLTAAREEGHGAAAEQAFAVRLAVLIGAADREGLAALREIAKGSRVQVDSPPGKTIRRALDVAVERLSTTPVPQGAA
jgi:hypothetical protein